MGKIIDLTDEAPHVAVPTEKRVDIIAISTIRMIANGKMVLSEFEKPDEVGQALAVLAMEGLDGAY